MYIATVQIVFKCLQSLSVVSFNNALYQVESFIVSYMYFGFRFTNAYN